MEAQNPPTVQTLYPSKNSLKEVIQTGIAQLPIESPNGLIALLQLQRNTLLNLTNKQSNIGASLLATLQREFDIVENACDFWKQEAIDRGYKE